MTLCCRRYAVKLAGDDGVRQVAAILGLKHKSQEVRDRVNQVLVNYRAKSVLLDKNILKLIWIL